MPKLLKRGVGEGHLKSLWIDHKLKIEDVRLGMNKRVKRRGIQLVTRESNPDWKSNERQQQPKGRCTGTVD